MSYNTLNVLNYTPDLSYGIGDLGEHLTVVILSLERAKLTIKLLESFAVHMPFFKGLFLIIDNGSTHNTLQQLQTYQQQSTQSITLVPVKTNLGVAGGRNYALQFVTTDWLMFLDNDIYLDGNFLPMLHHEINSLGAHFVSLPLKNPDGTFFAKGGKLYITNIDHNFLHIGGGSANASLNTPEYGSFLFGGASVLNKETFRKLGLFNQLLFIGFEDTELSIRLWKQGYKIGNSTVKCFIHDHPIANIAEEINYEKKRFSLSHIIRSAQYAEQQHHFGFLSNHDLTWLQTKLNHYTEAPNTNNTALPLLKHSLNKKQTDGEAIPTPKKKMGKVKVAIITDVLNWAFANIAFNVINQANKSVTTPLEFVVIPHHDSLSFNDNALHILLAATDCHILHFMWRAHLFNFEYNIQKNAPTLDFQSIKTQYLDGKILSTCVYDHNLLPHDEPYVHHMFQTLIKNNYYVSSYKLYDLYSSMKGIEKPRAICPDGVDLNLFKPYNLARFYETNLDHRPINIGWTGNSHWGNDDHKGLHSVIKPAITRLIAEGYDIQFNIADRHIKWREQHEMPEFYNSLDILLCASRNEGTPNVVLEAMACGIAVITSDVGIVKEALGPHQQTFIIERTTEAFYHKIKYLLEHNYLLHTLSLENVLSIKSWDWSIMSQNLLDYFYKISIESPCSMMSTPPQSTPNHFVDERCKTPSPIPT